MRLGIRNRLDRASRKYIPWMCRGCSAVDPLTLPLDRQQKQNTLGSSLISLRYAVTIKTNGGLLIFSPNDFSLKKRVC